MTIKLLKLDEKDFDSIYQLMERSFPVEEVRSQENARAQLRNSNYTIWTLKNETNEMLGFIAEWNLGATVFVEHFAVAPTSRSGGIGSGMMAAYLSRTSKPVMIEVEDEKTEINLRRIGFYQRLGFHLSEYGYDQPVMRGDASKKIPLKIMRFPQPLTEEDFKNFRNQVFTQIYQSIDA